MMRMMTVCRELKRKAEGEMAGAREALSVARQSLREKDAQLISKVCLRLYTHICTYTATHIRVSRKLTPELT